MTMPDDAKKQKEKADQLVARVKGDPDFKRQAIDDPLGVLRQAGLSDEAIGDILREEGYLSLDPKDAKPKQKDAIEAARLCESCCISCVFTSGCTFTVG